jgi:mono/diheme cytochrome c family protein
MLNSLSMRSREIEWVVFGWLLTGLAVAPLAAQSSSGPQPSRPLPRLQAAPPSAGTPGQIQNAPSPPALVFDAETKQYDASPGERVAPFTFNVTNAWTEEITIDDLHASCGCTTAVMPAKPWHIPPKGGGPVQVQVNLAGKMGLITKTLTFYYKVPPDNTNVRMSVVYLKVNIPPPPSVLGTMTEAERKAAVMKATADAQAIFRGDCAQCHADKGRKALGQDLYAADCGICHESSHREKFVPDLHALKQATDFDYWKTVITLGKPHTMMPAFAAAQGGPLSEAQISSLATYLDHTISHHLSGAVTHVANAAVGSAEAAP